MQDAIQKKETSTHDRIELFKKDHNEALLKMDKMREDVELNRYLERDYKNFKTYRAAVLWKLKGGNPTDSDPIQALGAAVGGELILSDMDSHLSDAEFILRDLQELGNHLAQQIEQDSKNH